MNGVKKFQMQYGFSDKEIEEMIEINKKYGGAMIAELGAQLIEEEKRDD
jgi:hypothetical protein